MSIDYRRRVALWCLVIALAGAQAAAAVDKWEYGELRFDERIATRRLDGKAAPRVVWMAAKDVIVGADWDGLAEKIQASALSRDILSVAKEQNLAVERIAVLNRLGELGWEVVSQQPTDSVGTTRWIFKRKVEQ